MLPAPRSPRKWKNCEAGLGIHFLWMLRGASEFQKASAPGQKKRAFARNALAQGKLRRLSRIFL